MAFLFVNMRTSGEGSVQAADKDRITIPDPIPQTSGVASLECCYKMIIKGDTAGITGFRQGFFGHI